jgi:predicted Rossmann fold nucleotide-binding protein DprA/Smf involved in DNA uptake
MTRSDRSLASLLLVQRLVESPAEPLKASEYWPLFERVPSLEHLLGQGARSLVTSFDLDEDLAAQVAVRLDAASALAFRLEELDQAGLQALTPVDDGYPAALADRLPAAPPVLYAAGDLTLMARPLLGIVGSRGVDEDGAAVARAAARAAVRNGHGVVSGGAKGVDQLSMRAALDEEGTVVGVLADSLERALREPETRRAISEGLVCMCTPYKPTAGFSVANAMGRNKVIYALSASTLVVSSEVDSGGTWAGAKEALAKGIAPVVSWTGGGSGSGNKVLVERGAQPLSNVDDLFPLPEREAPVTETVKDQLALEL